MSEPKQLLFLPGDGIGPEVMGQVRKIIDWLSASRSVSFEVTERPVGGACYDAHDCAVTDETIEIAMNADAVMLGAVGGPKWDNVEREKRPEAGLLRLRKELDLFANLRPALVFDALVESSTLKDEVVRGLDIMIVRELTSGVYFGEPRGVESLPGGGRKGFDTQVYTDAEIARVGRVAFDLAKKRSSRVHSVEKANVMESGAFWREEITQLHQAEYADMELQHMYADNCAMQLVRNPKQFDVIVTDNLFGDLLSDCAAMLTGSLGMLPSASLSGKDQSGKVRAMYEPVHGSAPDIAGQDLANPLATILSFSMCLRYSFDMAAEADMLDQGVQSVLAAGVRTGDIMQDGMQQIGCTAMGDAFLAELDKLS